MFPTPGAPTVGTSKRPATTGNNVQAGSLQDRILAIEDTNPAIGTGDQANPLNLFVARQMVTMERRIANLEGVLYIHYDLPEPKVVADCCKQMGKTYSDTCRTQKGTKVGPASNYIFLGLLNGLLSSPKTPPSDMEFLRNWVMDLVGNQAKDGFDLSKAQQVYPYIPYCYLKLVEKRGRDPIAYLTLAYGSAADPIKPYLTRAILAHGTLNPSPPPPTPALLELKKELIKMGVINDPSL